MSIQELNKQIRFRSSYQTEQLAKRLTALAESKDITAVITYAELSSIAGRDVQHEGRSILYSAIRIVGRDSQALFSVVTNVGIKLMEVADQSQIPTVSIRKIKKATRRTLERMSRVEFAKFTPEQKQQHNTGAAVLGAFTMFADQSAIKKIAGQTTETKQLEFGETLKLFQ